MREDAETLRRRLYAPDADGNDLDRYRRAGGGRGPVARARPDRRRPDRPGSARRFGPVALVIAAVVAVALVVGGIGVARLVAPTGPTAPAPDRVTVAAADRSEFENNLLAGKVAGIAAYLLTSTPMARFTGTTRIETVESSGSGDDVVTLSPVSAKTTTGRATVFLVVAGTAQVGWTTLRRITDAGGAQRTVAQVHRAGMQPAGELTAHTYRYTSGNRPVELRVDVPDGVRWGVAVVFSD